MKTQPPPAAELAGVLEFERAIREHGEYDARLANLAALVFACACSGAPLDPPTVSLTCDFAEHVVITVPTDPPDPSACYQARTTTDDWRIAPLENAECPSEKATCVSAHAGDELIVYRSQRTFTHTGGISAEWTNCESACGE